VDDIKSFLKEIEHKTGAQLFVLTAFEKVDGSVAITSMKLAKLSSHLFITDYLF